MRSWLSWIERWPPEPKVTGSNPVERISIPNFHIPL